VTGESQTALSSAATPGISIKIKSKLPEKVYIKYTASAGALYQRKDDSLFPGGELELKTVSDDALNGAVEWTGVSLTSDSKADNTTITVDVSVYSDSLYTKEIANGQVKIQGDGLTFKPE